MRGKSENVARILIFVTAAQEVVRKDKTRIRAGILGSMLFFPLLLSLKNCFIAKDKNS